MRWSLLAEVSDKVPAVVTFWTIAAVGVAIVAVARYHPWTRRAAIAAAGAWAALNALDVTLTSHDWLGQDIVAEMGRAYFGHQLAAALLPLAFAFVPVRRPGQHRRGFEVIANEQPRP